MNRIAFLTDSASGINLQEAEELGIFIIPIPFFLDGDVYYENKTLSSKEFYTSLKDDIDISTSQPSPGDLMSLWNTILEEYDQLIYIPMSSGLSSSCTTAKMLAQAHYADRVFVVDNKRISATQRQSVLDAMTLSKKGVSAKDIQQQLESEAYEASIYIAVGTLKYLKKGGRITPAVAAIGTVLNIKPILQIQGDRLDTFSRSRGMKQAQRTMIEAIKNDLNTRFKGKNMTVCIAYSGSDALGHAWRDKVQESFPEYNVEMFPLALGIACHTGEGALGIGCIQVTV